ncbi:hypothetical protein VB711_19100 [Cronbergia sp. UHCC 0137]|uniref:hypothetical protein n=1 Tax=Cronbergia sp. UHCC 0137 TaxID=3110239 RepID=UPI002B217CB5|nr:hypothetical protein [Cronbergia sp. UHCC 0137]MEA5619936.1 hypothetical protein [Cronbergia sp. UHCC 0137]
MQKLQQLIKTRREIAKLQHEAEALIEDAIYEAIEVLGNAEGSKQTVYEDDNGKIVLVFKKQYATPQNDITLGKLEDDICRISGKVFQENHIEIEQLQKAIADLEKKRDKLLSNSYITRLRNEFKKHRETTMSLKPTLSVYL